MKKIVTSNTPRISNFTEVDKNLCSRCKLHEWEIAVRGEQLCAKCYPAVVQWILRDYRLDEKEQKKIVKERTKRFINYRNRK